MSNEEYEKVLDEIMSKNNKKASPDPDRKPSFVVQKILVVAITLAVYALLITLLFTVRDLALLWVVLIVFYCFCAKFVVQGLRKLFKIPDAPKDL